jgi:hypothetical protein
MSLRPLLFPLLLALATGPGHAAAVTSPPAQGDDALRRAVIGTWLHEKSAGVAKASVYTTYRDDGTAIELIMVKIVFKKATGVWTKYQWQVEHGALRMTPLLYRSNNEDTHVALTEIVRELRRVDQREMVFFREGKERKDVAAEIPPDVQKMIDELSRS